MERTFSWEARAVVPTTQGFTSATPSAGSKNDSDQNHEGHGIAHRSKPGGANGAEQEVRAAENQVRQGKSTAKAEAVGDRAAENGQKPDQPAEESGEIRGALGGKGKRFVEITSERGEGGVIAQPFKEFTEIGDPEGALEAGADVVETLLKGHEASKCRRSPEEEGELSGGGMIAEEGLMVVRSILGMAGEQNCEVPR